MMEVKQQSPGGCIEKFNKTSEHKIDSTSSSVFLPESEEMDKLCYIDSDEDQTPKSCATELELTTENGDKASSDTETHQESSNGEIEDMLLNNCYDKEEKSILDKSNEECNSNNEDTNIESLEIDSLSSTPTQDENILISSPIKTAIASLNNDVEDKSLKSLNEPVGENNIEKENLKVLNSNINSDTISEKNNGNNDTKLVQNEIIPLDKTEEQNGIKDKQLGSKIKNTDELEVEIGSKTLAQEDGDDIDKLLSEIDGALGDKPINPSKETLVESKKTKDVKVPSENEDDDEIVFIELKEETKSTKVQNEIDSEDDDLIFFDVADKLEDTVKQDESKLLELSSDSESTKSDGNGKEDNEKKNILDGKKMENSLDAEKEVIELKKDRNESEETQLKPIIENTEKNNNLSDDVEMTDLRLEANKELESVNLELDKKTIDNDESKKLTKQPDTSLDKQNKDTIEDKIISDNSDNARDIFADKKIRSKSISIDSKVESNLRSSNEDKLDIVNEEQTNLESDSPAKKKLKLVSTDKTEIENKSNEDDDIVLIDEELSQKSLKRSISQDNLSNDSSKKPKLESVEEKPKFVAIELEEQKSTISSEPKLYPLPRPVRKSDLKLDFLKKFKHSFHVMSKSDLSELVCQKIIESILYKSEFGELRETAEKQSAIIEQQRAKLYELSKQLKDMEMVHNRVIRDLENKNNQFVMPVKITRAVGLQVVIPPKIRNLSTSSERIITPLNTPQGLVLPPGISINTTSNNSNTKLSIPSTSSYLTNASSNQPNSSNLIASNRGRSHQKFTPLRPDTPQNPSQNRQTTSVLSTNLSQKINAQNSQQQLSTQQQILQKQQHHALVQKQLIAAQQKRFMQQPAPTFNKLPATNTYSNVRKSTSNSSNISQLRMTSPQQQLQTSAMSKGPLNYVRKSTGQIRPTTNALIPSTPINTQKSPITTSVQKAQKSFIDLTDDEEAQNGGLPPLIALQQQQIPSSTRIAYATNKQQNIGASQRSLPNNINRNPQSRVPVNGSQNRLLPTRTGPRLIHPAPLPRPPPIISTPSMKELPPIPSIHISNISSGIVISWTMDDLTESHADVTTYQIYAYQETTAAPQTENWRHVGDVKAMLLPMAVTLTQFQEGQKYFFAVRAVDVHNRCGSFSTPQTWA